MTFPAQFDPVEKMPLHLPGGIAVSLPVCRPEFKAWSGWAAPTDHGTKPMLDHGGEAFSAELLILRLLQQHGWDGVWVQTNGGIDFFRSMPAGAKSKSGNPKSGNPTSGQVEIPDERVSVLRSIWHAGGTTACFDLFVWQGQRLMFCKVKHRRRDRVTFAQRKFIDGALACGFAPSQLLVVEWDEAPGDAAATPTGSSNPN
jgi:hypothetical protein